MLLRKALQRSSKIAITTFAFHGRERLGMLRVLDNVIVLQSLRWDDEIRSPAAIAPHPSSLTDDEIKAGIELLETLAQDDVRNLSDHYREALEELLIAKTEHRKPVPVGGTHAEPAGQVVDLMAALNANVEAAKASRGEIGTDGSAGTVHDLPTKRTPKTATAKEPPVKKAQPSRPSRRAREQRAASLVPAAPAEGPVLFTGGGVPPGTAAHRAARLRTAVVVNSADRRCLSRGARLPGPPRPSRSGGRRTTRRS